MYRLILTGPKTLSGKSALIVASAALALLVMLLWFGSVRDADPVSADEGGLSQQCSQVTSVSCEGATGQGSSAALAASELNGHSSVLQLADARVPATSGGGQEESKCLLPGIPCTSSSGASNWLEGTLVYQ